MKLVIFLSVFSLIFSSVNANSRDDEDWESKTYNIRDFTEIYLEGGYKIFLSQGDECSLTVKASDNDVFDVLKVRNEGEELHLKVEREHFDFDRINLYITFKDLKRIKIEGGVSLKTKGYLDLKDFFMHVEGGAKIELDMKARNVQIIGEGGVLFELDGVAESLDVKVSGAGHVDASELKSKDVSFKIEGVGTGSVYATETLFARIDGVGTIKYRGDPKVTKEIEGLGKVKRD